MIKFTFLPNALVMKSIKKKTNQVLITSQVLYNFYITFSLHCFLANLKMVTFQP